MWTIFSAFHWLVRSFVQTSTFSFFSSYTYTYPHCLTKLWHLFQSFFFFNGYRMEAFSKVSRKSFNFMDIWEIKLWLHHKPFCVRWHVWVSLDVLSCLAVFAEFDPDQPLTICMWICRQYSKKFESWCVRAPNTSLLRPLALCALCHAWLNPLPGITSVSPWSEDMCCLERKGCFTMLRTKQCARANIYHNRHYRL